MTLNDLLALSEKNMAGCYPPLINKTKNIITDLYNKDNVQFAVFAAKRNPDEQYALWMQGRLPISEVNKFRWSHGLPCITEEDNSKRVTNIKFSWHCVGLAVDLVENSDPESSKMKWSWSNIVNYKKIGNYAGKYGLDWGGMWKSIKDYPHLEYTRGRNIVKAEEIYHSEGTGGVWEWI